MIYLLKFLYSWLLPPAVIVLLLRQYGWQRPVLETSAFHMRRAVEEFERAGVAVTPYPVGYSVLRSSYWNVLSWAPSADALSGTSLALKEYLGLAALWLR